MANMDRNEMVQVRREDEFFGGDIPVESLNFFLLYG